MNFFEKFKGTWPIYNPQIRCFPVFLSTGSPICINIAAKILFNPINKRFMGIGNIDSEIVLSPNIIWRSVAPQNNATLSVKNSSQVNKFFSLCKHKSPTSKSNYNNLVDTEQVKLIVNVASEKTPERVKRCSRLYGNIERLAEMTSPLKHY